jgi:transposase
VSNRRRRQRLFWETIAEGDSSEQAAGQAGVSAAVGARWFREAGGMRPSSVVTPSGRYLSFEEREEIALLRAQQIGIREIASRIGRSPSTV